MKVFQTVERFKKPYKFVITSDFFKEEEVLYLNDYALNIVDWKLHIESFFEQYEYKVGGDKLLPFEKLERHVKTFIEQEFSIPLSNESTIVFHKLVKGQKISIHNDCPTLGYETHRLVVNLNADYRDENGGHFYICSERNSSSIIKIIRPLLNSAFGFAAAKNSFHAIGEVISGERYSLVFSFYHIGNTNAIRKFIENSIASARKLFVLSIPKEYLDILTNFELHKIKNNRNNLLEHLIDTYCLLKSWGEDDLTAQVGLFHSLLGTKKFQIPKASEAEDWLNLINTNLCSFVKNYKTFSLSDSGPGNITTTTTTDALLIKVYFANLFSAKINITFDSNEWDYEKSMFLHYQHILSYNAISSISKLYF